MHNVLVGPNTGLAMIFQLWNQLLPVIPIWVHRVPMHKESIRNDNKILILRLNSLNRISVRFTATKTNICYLFEPIECMQSIHPSNHTCECDPCAQGLAASLISSSSWADISPQFLCEQIGFVNQSKFHLNVINYWPWNCVHTRQVFRSPAHHIHIAAYDVLYSLMRSAQIQLWIHNKYETHTHI